MKSFVNFIFGMLLMILLFACNPNPNPVNWETHSHVTVTWTPPTHFEDGSPIPSDSELRYELFIDIDEDDTHKDMIKLTKQPIEGTSFTTPKIKKREKKHYYIDVEPPVELKEGHYYLGVRAVLFKNKNGEPIHSQPPGIIAWSSSKTDTNKKPFGMYLKK